MSTGPATSCSCAEVPEQGPLAVLVADDDSQVLGLVRMCLLHHQVTAAPSGQAACEQLRQRHFDVVITDMRMPLSSGADVVACARQTQPEALVVAMTGAPQIGADPLLETRPDVLIPKPFRPRDLRAVVDGARGLRRSASQPA